MNPKDLVGAKKAPLKLVPGPAVIGMADGLSVGAVKYGPFNWRLQPIEGMTYVEAAYRHLMAWVDGQDYSEDTEAVVGHPVHHIDHALAGLGILRDAIASGQWVDNRPPKGSTADLLRAMDHSTPPAKGSDVKVVEVEPRRFLCGHAFGEEPITDPEQGRLCGTAVHWSRVNGVEEFVAVERECNCNPEWTEHSFDCPLFHVGRT